MVFLGRIVNRGLVKPNLLDGAAKHTDEADRLALGSSPMTTTSDRRFMFINVCWFMCYGFYFMEILIVVFKDTSRSMVSNESN